MDDLTLMKRLAAALLLAVVEAHPVYGNTTGHRGGIGGQALTPGCSFIDPPSRNEDWTQSGLLQTPVSELLAQYPELADDILNTMVELKAELNQKLK